MRNLKKVLSLALAMVMLLGMMVVGAGATSFKDDADITHKEAVAVVSGIGVLQGVDDGSSFNPKGTLTRAEAAVVIAKLDLGAAFGNLATTNASTFKDVGTGYGWAKPYIDYCAARGLIAGDGNGYFHPADDVTGVEFALMVSRVLGYEDANESIGGADWQVNAAALARKAGLTIDVTLGSTAIPRDDMAQVAFNALQSDMVEYDGRAITIGDVTIPAGKAKPVEIRGEGSANYAGGAANSVGLDTKQLCEEKFPALKLEKNTADEFGRPANKWVERQANGTVTALSTNAQNAALTYTSGVTKAKIYSDLGMTNSRNVPYYKDGALQEDGINLASGLTGTANTIGGNGTQIQVFTDNVGAPIMVVEINSWIGQVSRVSTKDDKTTATITRLNNGPVGANSFETNAFEKGDYVIYTVGKDSGDNVIVTMEPAESKTGTVTGTSSNKYLRLDGEKYDYSKYAKAEDVANIADVALGDATIYLDTSGYVIYVGKVAATEAQYLYVKGVDVYFSELSIRAVLADGTTQTFTVDGNTMIHVQSGTDQWKVVSDTTAESANDKKLSDVAKANLSDVAGKVDKQVFAYTTTDDNTVKLTDNGKIQDPVTGAAIEKNSNRITTGTASSLTIKATTDNATVFVMTGSGTIYTGYRNVPSLTNVSMVEVQGAGSVADIIFISNSDEGDSENAFYFFVPKGATRESFKDGSGTFYRYNVYVNGEEQEITVNSTVATKTIGTGDGAAGLYRATRINDKEYVTDATKTPLTSMDNNQATYVGADTLVVNGARYTYDDETMFILVAKDGKSAELSNADAIIMQDDTADKGSDITYVYVAETKTGKPNDATVVYVLAAEKTTLGSSTISVPANTPNRPTTAELNNALANAQTQQITLPADQKIPAGVQIPNGKTVILPSSTLIDATSAVNVPANSTLKVEGTKLPTITGAGTVNVTGAIEATQDLDALAALIGNDTQTVAKPADNPATVTLKSNGVLITGTGTLEGYWAGKPISEIVGADGGRIFKVTLTELVNGGKIKGEKFVGGEWVALTGVLGDGNFAVSGSTQDIVLFLTNGVEQVRFTITTPVSGGSGE